MIKNIKLFPNNNPESTETAKLIKNKFLEKGFTLTDDNYTLAIAIGGDGSILRTIKENNFNSDIYYVGINCGTLGFMQEIKTDEINKFITELQTNKYRVEEVAIQETIVNHNNQSSRFFSLNEIIVRDKELKMAKLDISIDGDLLENFVGDGVLIATSSGSTAQNLSYGGSIVYNTFTSLQITPMGPINSKVYHTLINSVIVPDKKKIKIVSNTNKNLMITIDGENNFYDNVDSIITTIDNKKIKYLRLSHYNFPQKINEKLLNS